MIDPTLFAAPPREFRPVPMWFWNGDLEEAEIRRQVQAFADGGLGGFQIAARTGLSTPYLSQRWFDLVELASREAAPHGLQVWLADEYPYPSGAAGGELTVRHPEWRAWHMRPRSASVQPGERLEVDSTRNSVQRHAHVVGNDPGHEKVGGTLDALHAETRPRFRAHPRFPASLAAQVGLNRVLVESYHSIGWSLTFQDMKALADRLAAQGANLFVFHAFLYSLGGLRKWDAPPSQFLQNPYWSQFPASPTTSAASATPSAAAAAPAPWHCWTRSLRCGRTVAARAAVSVRGRTPSPNGWPATGSTCNGSWKRPSVPSTVWTHCC